MPLGERQPQVPRIPALVAAIVVAGLGAGGAAHVRSEQRRFRAQAEAQLLAVADLKVAQLSAWRRERLADAIAMAQNRMVARGLKRLTAVGSDPALARELRAWLGALARVYGYGQAVLTDAAGRAVVSATDTPPPASHVARHLADQLRAGAPRLVDAELGDEDDGHFDLVTPIFDPDRDGVVVGALLLRMDLADFLLRLVPGWPTPSETAESLLVRTADGSRVFTVELRDDDVEAGIHAPRGTAEVIRLAPGDTRVGLTTDPRGVEVLAAVREVPGTPWSLVAKVDAAEILAPGTRQAFQLGAIFLLLMGSGVGALALWWRHRAATDRKEALRAVSFQAELLRNLYDAVIGLDAGHVIRSWNPAAERIYRLRAEEVLGKRIVDVLPSEYAGHTFEEFQEALHREGRTKLEVRRTLPGGDRVDVEASVAVVHGEDGRVAGYVTVNRDVTVRKRAEAALRASQERLARILETVSEGIWITDAAGVTEFVNARACRIVGTSPELAVGRPLLDAVPEPGRGAAREDIETVLRGEISRREFVRPGADGGDVWVNVSWTPLRGPDEAVAGAVGVFMDVTDHRRAREQLLHAQKMDAVGRLASGVAHDFNNLLVSILTCSGFLLEELPEGDPRREDAFEIKRAGERAAQLARQLLAFGRKSAIRPEAVSVNGVVERVEGILRRTVGADVRLVTALEATQPVQIDRGQLEQVVMNLAVNARDAMPRGGELRIETADVALERPETPDVRLPAGRYALLRVTDQGSGIPPEILPRIFEPFFTTKEEGHGTGLGLSTVYGIVKEAGGTVTVASAAGRGTTFTVHLPACAAVEPPETVHQLVASRGDDGRLRAACDR
jgi:PAS domain S-box-containing protein